MFQIIGRRGARFQHRGYKTPADRKRAITALRKQGFNYFVCYLEACPGARAAEQTNALQFSTADWVKPGGFYVDW